MDRQRKAKGTVMGIKTTTNWVFTYKRLPEVGSTVLGFWNPMGSPVKPNCYAVATFSGHTHWHDPEDDEDDYAVPLAWAQLPEPPDVNARKASPGTAA